MRYRTYPVVMMAVIAIWSQALAQDATVPVGVVCNVKVLSDKVPDVSSMEAWKKSVIHDGMSDQDKALAAWKSNCMFVYQDSPPSERMHEGCVHDTIKSFNVYGYGMCCCASGRVVSLARYLGLEARGYGIIGHSISEVKWDDQWHFLDASLLNYFTTDDGKIASVADITKAVQDWLKDHPELKGNDAKLRQFMMADGWTGWQKGPALLANCKFYDASGWWPAKTHGWYSTMQEFDGSQGTPFPYEYGYSQGYQVNIQLRPGEKLTRNWFHKGLNVNEVAKDGGGPGCLAGDKQDFYKAAGKFNSTLEPKMPDLSPGRVGSGTSEYSPPLADKNFQLSALRYENLASKGEDNAAPALHVKDDSKQGILEIRMPSSYVYLSGRLSAAAVVGEGGKVGIYYSDNNGLDWKEVTVIEKSGPQDIDLSSLTLRRYDYRLRFVLGGKGTGLESLKIAHTVQCSQRALPALDRGDNTISFLAGPQESTVTIEGAVYPDNAKKGQLVLADYHPELKDIDPQYNQPKSDRASITFPIATPGDMTRLRFGGHMRLRDERDQWEMSVSYDGGKKFSPVAKQTGPYQGICKYITVGDVPPGTRQALVRWTGQQRNTCCLFFARIDADYKPSAAGFRPVRVTYVWEEGGIGKKDVHVAKAVAETYKITCEGKPTMKSMTVELAD